MARYRTAVQAGAHTVWVEADDPKELIQEVSYWTLLGMGAEGEENAVLFYRQAGGYEYYGFRRPDGAEVVFGQLKKPDVPHHRLYSYHPASEGYKGYMKWDHDKKEQVPVSKKSK